MLQGKLQAAPSGGVQRRKQVKPGYDMTQDEASWQQQIQQDQPYSDYSEWFTRRCGGRSNAEGQQHQRLHHSQTAAL